jgi:hypothetical protein
LKVEKLVNLLGELIDSDHFLILVHFLSDPQHRVQAARKTAGGFELNEYDNQFDDNTG